VKRRPLAIQHLIDIANKAFPERTEYFASLAPEIRDYSEGESGDEDLSDLEDLGEIQEG
jgi:hypothetical protein